MTKKIELVVLTIIIIVINTLTFQFANSEVKLIYDGRHCGGESGCAFYDYIYKGEYVDAQTGDKLRYGGCVFGNKTLTVSCPVLHSYFGHTNYTVQCINSELIHSGYCSEKDFSDFIENKDCVVPEPKYNVFLWRLMDSGDAIFPGTYIKENESVRIICFNGNDIPYGGTGLGKCQSGKWIFEKHDDECGKDELFCEKIGCVLPDHPKNGKWVDEKTMTDLNPGRCVRRNTSLTVYCNVNFSYFGKKKFVWKCDRNLQLVGSGLCLGHTLVDYEEGKDCVVPLPLSNSKWSLEDTNENIVPETYVRDNTTIRTVCDSNFTSSVDENNNKAKCTSGQWTFRNSNSRCIPNDFKGFQVNNDCTVPSPGNNFKWFLDRTEIEVLPETYVKEGTKIRAHCFPNFVPIHGTQDVTTCKSGRWTDYKPICLTYSSSDTCSNRRGCVLSRHPLFGKWVDRETGKELALETCVQENTFVNASCDDNYNYYGYKKFIVDCINKKFPKYHYFCSDQNGEGYVPSKDCILPIGLKYGKWVSEDFKKEILPGAYVKDKSKIHSECLQNFTRHTEGTDECLAGEWMNGIVNVCKEIYVQAPNRSSYACLTPEHPDNGRYATWDSNTTIVPGKYAQHFTMLRVLCNKNYRYTSSITTAWCLSGKWDNIKKLGTCEAVCKTLNSTEQYKVTCISKNKKIENCTEPLDGTIAEITCQPVYQNLFIWESRSKFRFCLKGRWNNNVFPNCIPKTQCGLKAPNLLPLIVHGTQVAKGGYPWHVAIYHTVQETRTLICGGSLISHRLIISAAHCVTDTQGRLRNESNYEVAVGKNFPSFSDPRDEYSQSSTVMKMFIPDAYKGSLKNFVGDFSLLIAKESFNLHEGVLPICLNFGTDKFEEKILTNGKYLGYLPGFGITETGKVSEVLKEIAVPLVKHDNCSKYLPEDFIEYYSYDKFCAGYLNESTAACSGDSGGGLAVQNPLDDRFYLIGVVSVSPRDVASSSACDIQQYTLYTKVADYIDFVRDEGADYLQIKTKQDSSSPSTKECQKYRREIPDSPTVPSTYFNLDDKKFHPGDLPFFALIGSETEDVDDRWFCTGSLISDRFILTAASALLERNSSLIVGLDIYNEEMPHRHQIEEIYTFPDYNPPQVYNDIALIKLDKKVQFSEVVYPACLDTETDFDSEQIKVEGLTWTWLRIVSSGHLELESHTAEECEGLFRKVVGESLSEGFVDVLQFCAKLTIEGFYEEIDDYCELFPGSPFPIVKEEAGKKYYSVAGITSYFKDCTRVNNFLLFTKISGSLPWIESIVWPSSEYSKNLN